MGRMIEQADAQCKTNQGEDREIGVILLRLALSTLLIVPSVDLVPVFFLLISL